MEKGKLKYKNEEKCTDEKDYIISLEKTINERYKIPLSSKIKYAIEDILSYFLIGVYLIFRPINLIIMGLLTIIILLIL